MRRRSYDLDSFNSPKYKYSFKDKTYDLNLSSSVDSKLGVQRVKEFTIIPNKMKEAGNFTLQKILGKGKFPNELVKMQKKSINDDLKLPTIQKRQVQNPQNKNSSSLTVSNASYYLGRIAKSLNNAQNGYLVALTRQHFIQTIQALRIGKNIKLLQPRQLKLSKKNPKFKTVYLDLDETLIHCDESSNNYTVKLDFPVEGGSTVSAGIRVRPYCLDFIRDLASIAQIIIFTASSASYADVVLDYLDPQKKYFSHRLYRHHCTLERGFYTKDLRCVNRRLEDSVLVDNSGFSFMLQPQNGVPILPYYHFNKDKQLPMLLQFLKKVIDASDVREKIRQYFFWSKYLASNSDVDPKKIFVQNYYTV